MPHTPIVLLLLLCVGAALGDRELVQTAVDLSESADRRWTPALDAALKGTPGAAEGLRAILRDTQTLYARAGCGADCTARLAARFAQRYPSEFAELRGALAALVRGGALAANATSAEELAAHQYQYEVFHTIRMWQGSGHPLFGCTAIVACGGESAQQQLHARQLDWSLVQPYRAATFALDWKRENRTLFSTVQFFWDFGTITAVRQGLSASLNWRSGQLRLEDVIACAESASATLSPIKSALRGLFERSLSFTEAVAELSTQAACAPVYLVLGGAKQGQGVVLAKDANASVRTRWLDDCSDAAPSNGWFVAQSNNDWWEPIPLVDDRASLAGSTLIALGRKEGATLAGQWAALSTLANATTRGVLNEETVFSSVLDPVSGQLLKARIREFP